MSARPRNFVMLLLALTIASVIGLHAQAPSRTMSSPVGRYALLLGVSEYPNGVPGLKGSPANDVQLMRDALVNRLGFAARNILTLTDRKVTRTQVISAIRQHLGQAGANDVALLYFSGHGIQLDESLKPASSRPKERDQLDEALLMWDASGERATYLLDDELGLLLDELRSRRTIVIVDACHSGSSTRAVLDDDVRWSSLGHGAAPRLPFRIDDGPSSFLPKRVLRDDARSVIVPPETLLTMGTSGAQRRHLLLSAALDGEVALGGPIKMPDGSKKPFGLFTTALHLAIGASTSRTSLDAVMTSVRRAVSPVARRIQGSPQTPTATGAWMGESLQQFFGWPTPATARPRAVR